MNLVWANSGNVAREGTGISGLRAPRDACLPLFSRQLAAGIVASLIAHGFLIAAIMRVAPPVVAAPGWLSPVEVVLETQQRPKSARDNFKRPPEFSQNRPDWTGDLGKGDTVTPLGFDSAVERAARDLKPVDEKGVHAESQIKTGVADRFKAVAVPLPSSSGTEAMSYRFIVGGMLERGKHYPERALRRGAKGTATIGFVLDRSGGVASVSLLRSSGDSELDAESVGLVRRAAPFPAAPPGAEHSFTIEVAFGKGI
jgi:TonB family protein